MFKRIWNKLVYTYDRNIRIKLRSELIPFFTNFFTSSPKNSPKDIKEIIVANIDSLGDATWCTPLFREIKEHYPNSSITLICNKICLDIFSFNPFIDEIITIDPNPFYIYIDKELKIPRLEEKFKDKKIDLFIIAEMGARPADNLRLLAKRLHSKFILSSNLGILKNSAHFTYGPNLDSAPLWWPHYFLKMLTPITNKEYDQEPELEIYHDEKTKDKVDQWIKVNNPNSLNIILIHPMVAGYGLETKKWSDHNFRQVIDHLLRPNNLILISGGPNEIEVCNQFIKNYSNPRVRSIAGEFTIKELTYLLKKVDLSISCDTSLFHFSKSAQVPTIGIFGATNSNKIAPHTFNHVKVFHSSLECWPCHKNKDFSPYWPKCIYSEAKCLKDTKPEVVISYIEKNYPHLTRENKC